MSLAKHNGVRQKQRVALPVAIPAHTQRSTGKPRQQAAQGEALHLQRHLIVLRMQFPAQAGQVSQRGLVVYHMKVVNVRVAAQNVRAAGAHHPP